MSFNIYNQEKLEQLCREAPPPGSIYISTLDRLYIGANYVPFICHDSLRKLEFNGKFDLSDGNQSGPSAKQVFGDCLLNSTSIEELIVWNPDIYEWFLYSIHRKPLLNSLRSLTLRYALMNNKKMLLFARAVKFSPHLVTIRIIGSSDTITSNSITASVFCLLHLNPKLKSLNVSGFNDARFSTLRLCLLHRLFAETKCKRPDVRFNRQEEAYVVRQIFAKLVRTAGIHVFHFSKDDFNLLTANQRDYLSNDKICSHVKFNFGFITFTMK